MIKQTKIGNISFIITLNRIQDSEIVIEPPDTYPYKKKFKRFLPEKVFKKQIPLNFEIHRIEDILKLDDTGEYEEEFQVPDITRKYIYLRNETLVETKKQKGEEPDHTDIRFLTEMKNA